MLVRQHHFEYRRPSGYFDPDVTRFRRSFRRAFRQLLSGVSADGRKFFARPSFFHADFPASAFEQFEHLIQFRLDAFEGDGIDFVHRRHVVEDRLERLGFAREAEPFVQTFQSAFSPPRSRRARTGPLRVFHVGLSGHIFGPDFPPPPVRCTAKKASRRRVSRSAPDARRAGRGLSVSGPEALSPWGKCYPAGFLT